MTKEEIHNICSKYNITNYTINDDLSIDVDGDVNLYYNNFKELPLKFRNVYGLFDCSYNRLTLLNGAPSYVGKWFGCSVNPLESLKGIPLNLSYIFLYLPDNFTYSDYLDYSNIVKRDLKFKKILK